jgi:flagella basal body P-ring formation protein FlgA
MPLDALTQRAEFDGRVVKVALPKGKFITQSILETPPLVKKQDLVDLVSERNGLVVSVKGIVLMDGQRDEVIRVRNSESKRELYGTVKDARTVLVR